MLAVRTSSSRILFREWHGFVDSCMCLDLWQSFYILSTQLLSPIRTSAVEHFMNSLFKQLLPTLRIWKDIKEHIQGGYLACLDQTRDINILHLSSCQYLSYNDIIVPMTFNVKWRSTLWKQQLLRRRWQKEQGKFKGKSVSFENRLFNYWVTIPVS